MTRLEQQLRFILEMDKEKMIVRQTYLSDASRKENDAEHAWHLALMCLLLKEYANEDIDVFRTMCMVLIHDVVEIEAGDTYAYDAAGAATQKEREKQAADHLFGLLPQDQEAQMRSLFEEFEAMETPESKFARSLDKVQPLLLNDASDGRSWREHDVAAGQVLKRNERTHEGSEVLWAYAKELIEKHTEKGNLKK